MSVPRRAPAARSTPAPPPALPAGLRTAATLATFAALAALVSFPISDPDLWQHLRTGQAIWESGRLEPRNVWTWPTYGAPHLIPSWLFRVMLWPFWSAGGVAGLFAWRWLTTLACFGLLWAAARAARRPGSAGLAALFVLLWCGVLYRFRSQVRPETLVAVLLAAQLWLLESRRARAAAGDSVRLLGLDRAWWVVPIAAVWINVHLSYVLALFVTGAYLLDEWVRGRSRPARVPSAAAPLALALAASAAACFLNPYGFALVRQPFDFMLGGRDHPALRMISELAPVPWRPYLPTGLPLLVALPPALALWRWRRSGPDLAQLAILAVFLWQGLSTQRFLGFTAVAIAPFFARDLGEFCTTRRWPAWFARPATRAGLAAALAALLLWPAFAQRPLRPSIAFRASAFPAAACDAVDSLGIRGRSFGLFSQGGYQIWRFWPERDRLPFMDVHQTGTPEDLAVYPSALTDSAAWAALDRRYTFDWVLLPRSGLARGPLLETLDADTSRWAAVFVDDVAAVFVRRDGANAEVAARHGYRWLPAGDRRLADIADRMGRDPVALAGMIADLERVVRESRQSASFRFMLGNIEWVRGHPAEALAHYDSALAVEPDLPGLRVRRGMALLQAGRPAEALAALRAARRHEPPSAITEALMGRAFRALGRTGDARRAWRRALELDPGIAGVPDSLAAVDREEVWP